MATLLRTERLVVRDWRLDDADAALGVYGRDDVARWLSPAMDKVPDAPAMRLILQQWIAENDRVIPPAGRWALERADDGTLVGGVILLPLPPGDEDLEIGWQLHPGHWGNGYATEVTKALSRWALQHGTDEVFAVVRPGNKRAAATIERSGMEWVGETGKYFDLTLQVYRLRAGDLDHPF